MEPKVVLVVVAIEVEDFKEEVNSLFVAVDF